MAERDPSLPSLPRAPNTPALAVAGEGLPHRLSRELTCTTDAHGLRVTYRWRRWPRIAALGAFAAVWNAIVLPLIWSGSIPAFFVVTHGGLAVLLAVSFVNGLFLTKRIEVAHGRLRVVLRPLPELRGVDVAAADVQQLYVRRTRAIDDGEERLTNDWEVWLRTTAGRTHQLLGSLATRAEARAAESAVEQALRIVDAPDPSEDGRM